MGFFARGIRRIIRSEMSMSSVEKKYNDLNLEKGCFGLSRERYVEKDVIISLTTYNKRIFTVFLTIESLFQQTVKANKIVLWLAKDEFEGKPLPQKLVSLIDRGLEINYCRDIKSYKKLIPTLALWPEAIIVTVDDDVVYPDDFLENLLNAYKVQPDKIHCYRARKFTFNILGSLRPYMKWKIASGKEPASLSILPNGIGGVLYFPGCFHDSVNDEKMFMTLAPQGDDIWFKVMTLLKGVECNVVPVEMPFFEKFVVIESGQDIALYHSNISSKENMHQIKAVFEYWNIDLKQMNL